MRRLTWIFFAFTLATPAQNTLTPEERAEGWELLFDGVSAEHWKGLAGDPLPACCWKVEDGVLKTIPGETQRDIISITAYENFEFQWEWRLTPGANSGVKYLVREPRLQPDWIAMRGRPARMVLFWACVTGLLAWLASGPLRRRPRKVRRWLWAGVGVAAVAFTASVLSYSYFTYVAKRLAVGPEYQLIDDEGNADARRGPLQQTGSLYALLERKQQLSLPVGEWNHSRVVVSGSRVEHWLNGETVLEYDLNDPSLRERLAASKFRAIPDFNAPGPGHLSLQHHSDEVWFRNMKVRKK
jgi:hypothetical protein